MQKKNSLSAWKKDIPQEKWRKSRRQKKGICVFNPAWSSPTMGWRWGCPDDTAHPRLVTLTPVRTQRTTSRWTPQMWGCAPKITLFPSIPQAHALSARSTSKASIGNISALTSLPHGHGTWDKQKPGSELKSKTGGAVDYMATNVICLPSLPIKS